MLYEDPKLPLADRTRFLGIIVAETERLSRLINQILDMAKLESGRAEWTTSSIDVGTLLREAAASLEALFNEKGLCLSLSIAAGLPPVLADRDRLTQVLINLLSNAVKFVPQDGGHVWLSVVSVEDAVRVSVRDNGPGLTADECGVIFEKFRQGGDTMTAKPQGTGLGLPISRQIIEHFGGRLWVESSPGQGADFMFTVPIAAPDA